MTSLSTTPETIRHVLWSDPTRLNDPQLVALLLGSGTTRRSGRVVESWSAFSLAEALYREAGGQLVAFVEAVCSDALDLASFGVGQSIGARLVSGVELADRWCRGRFEKEPDRVDLVGKVLQARIVKERESVSSLELLAQLVGRTRPDIGTAKRLLEAFGGPRELLGSFSKTRFEEFSMRSCLYLRLRGSDVELEFASFCRLLAAVHLARRYHARVEFLPPERVSVKTLGLASHELVRLLDPGCPLDSAERESLLGVLRSHPELAPDFAKLDELQLDAGTESCDRALSLHRQFEALLRQRGWTDPAEVLGGPIPYDSLLAIADARIARAKRPPKRILEVKELLERSEVHAAAQPVADCLSAMLALGISVSGAERLLEAAKISYAHRLEERASA